ncbi:MAG TPA: hypothetical protein VNA12_04725 [Mycobacteriales bacterium]|nr:hypothetical protein [Mycobacteriales bacterium]
MARLTTRAGRLTALALATGTLVVAGTGSAGAATVAVPDVFGGKAQGTAIHIEVNLPVAIPVPGLGTITGLVQDISFTEGTTNKDVTSVLSNAKAVLGNGMLTPLNIVSEASLTGKPSDSKSLVSIPVNPLISGGIGTITSSVSPETATSALTSTSSSSLASLRIGLGGLTDSLPLKTDLDAALNTVQSTVDATQGTLSSTINTALDTLNEVSAGATAPVAAQVEAVEQQLTTLLDQLQGTLANLTADSDLLSLSLLESSNTITRKGDMVEARALSAIGGLDILAGLVHVDAIKTESFSAVNGLKGSAAADSLTTVLGLKVADVLDLKLTDKGLSGTVAGQALPTAAQDAVNTVISSVNGLLATAGVNIVYGQKTSSVDPAGRTASSSSQGVGIVVNPPVLGLAKPLLAVQLVPAGTAVNAARLAKPAPVTPRVNTPRSLPRTGAPETVAIVGAGLVATAAVVSRRRRLSTEA